MELVFLELTQLINNISVQPPTATHEYLIRGVTFTFMDGSRPHYRPTIINREDLYFVKGIVPTFTEWLDELLLPVHLWEELHLYLLTGLWSPELPLHLCEPVSVHLIRGNTSTFMEGIISIFEGGSN